MADLPSDPFLPPGLADAMKAMYELFAAAKQAGFSDDQSMQLVIATLSGMIAKGAQSV
jgi:hypothetical protein